MKDETKDKPEDTQLPWEVAVSAQVVPEDEPEPETSEPSPVMSVVVPGRDDVAQLAQMQDGDQVFQQKVNLLIHARRAMLLATKPEDWSLYKRRDGNVTGYLDANGCYRLKDFIGVHQEGPPVEEKLIEGDAFSYMFSGMVTSRFFQTQVWAQGGRSSSERFFKYKKGLELAMDVRKASYKNFIGRAVKQLAGLDAVPLNELQAAGLDLARMSLAREFSDADREAWAAGNYSQVIGVPVKKPQPQGQQQQRQLATPAAANGQQLITEKQRKRFFAKTQTTGWSEPDVVKLLAKFGYTSSREITRTTYELLCACVDEEREPTPAEMAAVSG